MHTHTRASITTESWVAATLISTLYVVAGGSINTLHFTSAVGVVAVLSPITEVCTCYTLIDVYQQYMVREAK